jgi:hypothetical protein
VNRLALAPCLVVASYVAIASFIASPILYELGRSRVGLKIPTSVSNHGEVIKDSSSFTKEAISAHPSNEVPNKPLAIIEKPAAAVLLETPYQQSAWVMVLLPARVHTGPSVDTSSIFIRLEHRRVRSYRPDWFEIIEPSTSKTGWIYYKYLGGISDSEQSKIASQEA